MTMTSHFGNGGFMLAPGESMTVEVEVPIMRESEPTPVAEPAPLVKPDFSPKWWHRWYRRGRLDARPVIWSLQNRPEEWRVEGRDSYNGVTLYHKPSRHYFITGGSTYNAGINETTRCSCVSSSRKRHEFTFWQAYQFRKVALAFAGPVPSEREKLHKQFVAHFVK